MRKGFSSGRQCLRNLRRLVQSIDHIPRQQLLDAIDGMIGDAFEDVLQIPLRVDAIEFASFDKAINDRRTLTAAVGSEEQIIASSGSNTTNGALRNTVVYLQAPILGIAAQGIPTVQRVAICLGKRGFLLDL